MKVSKRNFSMISDLSQSICTVKIIIECMKNKIDYGIIIYGFHMHLYLNTFQIESIESPVPGLLVYDKLKECLLIFDGDVFVEFEFATICTYKKIHKKLKNEFNKLKEDLCKPRKRSK